jgi:putative membrane protein
MVNRTEYSSFFKNALSWSGSITPKVAWGVLFSFLYSLVITLVFDHYSQLNLDIGPFEYSGVVLGLLLVFRINSGYERWWEARKLWGSVVNQSRNLALISLTYSTAPAAWRKSFSTILTAFPYAMMESLRADTLTGDPGNAHQAAHSKTYAELRRIVGPEQSAQLQEVAHAPTWIASKLAQHLHEARAQGWMDNFTFQLADRQRSELVDALGGCERILKTPPPFVLVVKLKRFVLLFLLLLPFALASKIELAAPIIDALIAYPLLSLDQIGYELQNPFHTDRLSHLPLIDICVTIQKNILEIEALSSAEASRRKS